MTARVLAVLLACVALAAVLFDRKALREGFSLKVPPGWRPTTLTTFESYPALNSQECIDFKGCEYKGQFQRTGTKRHTLNWVKDRNIASVHSADFSKFKGDKEWVRVKFRGRTLDARVMDACADKDTKSKKDCTDNKKKSGFLIDLEKYTAARLGYSDGSHEAIYKMIAAKDVIKANLRGSKMY